MLEPNTVILRSSVILSFVLLSFASTSGAIPAFLSHPAHVISNSNLVSGQGGCGIPSVHCSDKLHCCPIGTICQAVGPDTGCCPIGKTCSGLGNTCAQAGDIVCPGEKYCCSAGDTCTLDSAGTPTCSRGEGETGDSSTASSGATTQTSNSFSTGSATSFTFETIPAVSKTALRPPPIITGGTGHHVITLSLNWNVNQSGEDPLAGSIGTITRTFTPFSIRPTMFTVTVFETGVVTSTNTLDVTRTTHPPPIPTKGTHKAIIITSTVNLDWNDSGKGVFVGPPSKTLINFGVAISVFLSLLVFCQF